MRYPADHKERTRQRVLHTASGRFRADGIDAVGVARLMQDAGLTHGGFYVHFRSKEQLVGEAMASAFAEMAPHYRRAMDDAPQGGKLLALCSTYLSLDHLTHAARGCPLAANGSEVARQTPAVREAFNQGMQHLSGAIQDALAADRIGLSVAFVMSLMVGALTTARTLPNLDAANEFRQSVVVSLAAVIERAREAPQAVA
jgi:TetR/AcrR family transcriptional repressor of nem operon